MCGIAGFAGFDDPGLLRRMTRVIAYRGPDDDGYHEESGVGLGHRRLSIIDLSTGHQPLWSDDGTKVIVYNGEVYNFPELREDLVKRGVRFATQSDTEVVVNLYQLDGPACVARLNGIFAFAIWDRSRRELFLARDQLGVKPLVYLEHDGVLLFGSEAKCVLEWPHYRPEVNPEAVRQNLVWSYVPGDETLFAGIRKLPPGHTLTFRDGRAKIAPYWTVDPDGLGGMDRAAGRAEDRGEDYYRKGLLDLLADSVRGQMISDVPLGATLSGGLDSSTIVALMSRALDRPPVTFTVGFGGPKDELDHARRVAEHCRTEHHEFIVDPSRFTETLPRVLWHLEEPVLSSIMPTWYLGEAARKLVTVILIGEGADEVFAGYRRLWPVADRFRSFVPPQLKEWFYFWHFSAMGASADDPLYAPSFARRFDAVDPVERWYRPAMRARRDQLNGLLLHEQRYELADFQLARIDKLMMAHSVEARVPFLDPRVVHFANRMPSHYKLRGNCEKYILRRAAQELLPASILERRKQGLGTPLIPWFRSGLYDVARDLLSPANVRARGMFDPAAVDRLFDTSRDHRWHREDLGKLFKLLMFEMWARLFIDRSLAPGPAPIPPRVAAPAPASPAPSPSPA